MHFRTLTLLLLAGGCLSESFDVGRGPPLTADAAADASDSAVVDTADTHGAADTADTADTLVEAALDAKPEADAMEDVATDTVDAVVDPPCATDVDCKSDRYCATCDSLGGTCHKRPLPSAGYEPVCGCDRVTYWNADLAVAAGRGIASSGACTTTAIICGPLVKCPSGAECVQEAATKSACGGDGGTCQRLTKGTVGPDCKLAPGPKVRGCVDFACTTFCEAAVAGKRFYKDAACP